MSLAEKQHPVMGKSKFDKFVEWVIDHQKTFWAKTYPAMSRDERIQFWLGDTYKSMRTQGEMFGDEYKVFSKEWYDDALAVKPDFDAIFAEAVKKLGFSFSDVIIMSGSALRNTFSKSS